VGSGMGHLRSDTSCDRTLDVAGASTSLVMAIFPYRYSIPLCLEVHGWEGFSEQMCDCVPMCRGVVVEDDRLKLLVCNTTEARA
jgi:hypothetical protein